MTSERNRRDGEDASSPVDPGRWSFSVGDSAPDAQAIWRRYVDLQSYVNWSADDERRLTAAYQLVRPQFDALVDDFYAEIRRHETTAVVLGGDERRVRRLKASLGAWMSELFRGPHDADYVLRRWGVGLRHVQIGLPHVFAIAALSRLRMGMTEILWSKWNGEPSELFSTVSSLNKLLDLDAAVIGDAYEQERVRLREEAERRKMADALSLERDLNSGFLAFAGAVAIVLDDQGRIVRGNSRFESLLGFELGRLYGQDWLEQFLSPEDGARWRAALFSAPRTAGSTLVTATSALRGADGDIHMHWTGAAVRDAEGKTRTALVLGNDVSELHEAQRRATQSERLAAIGEMAAGIAHESRASLQHIGWAAEVLEAELVEHPRAMEQLAKIRRSQEQLKKLFEDVRAYASPPLLDREPTRLLQAWREAWDLTASMRRHRHAELREHVPRPEPRASVDRVRLVQVFRNLFENALAAADDPVRIDIRVDMEADDPSTVQVRVRDNGPGLSLEQRRRLFEPFYTTKPSGTGLGLAISKRIVDAHGGTIRTGDAGPGAEFVITLPVAEAQIF